MKKAILFFALAVVSAGVFAQKLTTTSAVVSFDATTPKDALPKAENKTVIGSLDKTTGAIAFEAAVNNFAFTNPMIQDHFNGAQWLNSAQFPKFTFAGKIDKPAKVKYNKDGKYNVQVSGLLTVKGVSKPIKTLATITVAGGKVSAASSFTFKLADYGITGQAIDGGKVAPAPKVSVSASF